MKPRRQFYRDRPLSDLGGVKVCLEPRSILVVLVLTLLASFGCTPSSREDTAALDSPPSSNGVETQSEASSAPGEYVLGVMPVQLPEQLEATFAELAAEMARVVGRPVKFRTSSTWERYDERLNEEAYDLAVVDFFEFARLAPES